MDFPKSNINFVIEKPKNLKDALKIIEKLKTLYKELADAVPHIADIGQDIGCNLAGRTGDTYQRVLTASYNRLKPYAQREIIITSKDKVINKSNEKVVMEEPVLKITDTRKRRKKLLEDMELTAKASFGNCNESTLLNYDDMNKNDMKYFTKTYGITFEFQEHKERKYWWAKLTKKFVKEVKERAKEEAKKETKEIVKEQDSKKEIFERSGYSFGYYYRNQY